MTKKFIVPSIVLSLVLFGASVAGAQTTTPRDQREASMPKARLENRLHLVNTRFQNVISMMESVANRLTSRIEKIKGAGGNTVESERLLAEAKVSLEAAKASLTALTQATTQALNMESSQKKQDLRNTLSNMIQMSKTLKDNLKEARNSLSKAIGSLRGMSKIRPGTTTPETN